MFDSVIEFLKSAITEEIVKDPVWATIALVGQVVFGGRFVLQEFCKPSRPRRIDAVEPLDVMAMEPRGAMRLPAPAAQELCGDPAVAHVA